MKLGVVMDPIETINFKKDSTLAMMIEAQRKGHEIIYITPDSLFINSGISYASSNKMEVRNDPSDWFTKEEETIIELSELDSILMRQDPPFNSGYIYNTYVLEMAARQGVNVFNNPRSLRDCNEKVYATEFPQCCTEHLVTSRKDFLTDFVLKNKDTVIKPLDGMGGASIFRVKANDPNLNVILETITDHFTEKVMIQEFIPEITEGDKRILIVNGKPMSASIARVPAEGELRGNLAAGASAVAKSLSDRDLWICEEVGPSLVEKGLLLVGLDIIGDYLTEINVTSPTCFKEYKELCDIDVAEIFIESVEEFSK
jgi:glutathione synthase